MGYITGAICGLVFAYFAGSVALGDYQVGLIPGTALALWIGNYLEYTRDPLNDIFLSPRPIRYPLSYKEAFTIVSKVIREFYYKSGKSFHIKTEDNRAGEIKADIHWTDEHRSFDGKSKERHERHVRLEVYFHREGSESTSITFCWYPTAEGMGGLACHDMIFEFNDQLSRALPAGVYASYGFKKETWAAPAWLHIVAIFLSFMYVLSAFNHLSPLSAEVTRLEQGVDSDKKSYRDLEKRLDAEIAEWNKFKTSYRPEDLEKKQIKFEIGPPPTENNSGLSPLGLNLRQNDRGTDSSWMNSRGLGQ